MAGPPRDSAASQDILGEAFERDGPWRAGPTGPPEPAGRLLGRLGLRVALVLALLAVLDLAVRAALPPEALLPFMRNEFATYTVKVPRFAAHPAADVVFIGNSRVHDGLVPEVFAQGLTERWGRPVTACNMGLMNAKSEELSALVHSNFPDPPPRRVVIGVSGTELVNAHEFQYASRFLWSAGDFAAWLARTPLRHVEAAHVESFLEAGLCEVWYLYAERDVLHVALAEKVQDLMHDGFGRRVPAQARLVRVQSGRHNVADALAEDGYYDDQGSQTSLATMLARGDDVRIPPYSRGDFSELQQGADFPLTREMIEELRSRGCRVALAEMPPSPWLQEQCPEFHGELFRTRLAEFAESLGVPCVVMRPSDTFLTDATYIDANHLTRAGAQRYSRLLLAHLEEAGFFDEGP